MVDSSTQVFTVILMLILSTPFTAQAETYYVDGDVGNDEYDGLAPTHEDGSRGPKRTWGFVSRGDDGGVVRGDEVLFHRGTTSRRDDTDVDFRPSNMEGVTFGAYGDASLPLPRIDSQGSMGLAIGYHGPTEDLIFQDLVFETTRVRPQGEIITAYTGYAEGLILRRLEVDATNEIGVDVNDETITFRSNNVTIEDCYIHDGGRTGIYVGGSNNVFQRNRIENFSTCIKLNGDDLSQDDQPHHSMVRRNLCINTGLGLQMGTAHHNDVYGNIVVARRPRPHDDPRNFGVLIESISANNNVFNNTFVMSGENGMHQGVRFYNMPEEGNVIANNIIYFYDVDDDDRLVLQDPPARVPAMMNHNLFFSEGLTRWQRNNMTYESLEAWSATDGSPDTESIYADPLFIAPASTSDASEPTNFTLSEGSPGIDHGQVVSMHTAEPYEDFFGRPYVGAPDMGAVEFHESSCTSDQPQCASNQVCQGGTLDGNGCCVGGTCVTPEDGGVPSADGGVSPADGGVLASDGGRSDVGGSADGGAGIDAEGGCGCFVSRKASPSTSTVWGALLLGTLLWRRRH